MEKNCSDLLNDFYAFVFSRCQESKMFRYWNNVLILISLVHNLIRADRTGDWNLHVKTLEKLLPIFHVMDRINYMRFCAVYVEDILALSEKSPEILEQMLKGKFTVKRSDNSFTSVASDQALEQAINRSSKSASGIIGSTKKKKKG